jgi:heme-degrading monooxygenase HmoA
VTTFTTLSQLLEFEILADDFSILNFNGHQDHGFLHQGQIKKKENSYFILSIWENIYPFRKNFIILYGKYFS